MLALLDDPALLGAADAALFVVASPQGLDGATAALWERCAEAGLPRVVCVTQLDLPRADFDETVAVCQRVLGDDVHPLHLPMLDDDERVAGLIGLLDLQVADSSGGARVLRDRRTRPTSCWSRGCAPTSSRRCSPTARTPTLLDAYLDGDDPAPDVLRARAARRRRPRVGAAGRRGRRGQRLGVHRAAATCCGPSPGRGGAAPPVERADGARASRRRPATRTGRSPAPCSAAGWCGSGRGPLAGQPLPSTGRPSR